MICAVNVIANGGYLMRPYVVDRITTWEGETCKEFRPGLKRRVLNKETSERMKEAMARVVTDGTGKRAESKLYEVCGKTGTAQMVKPEGGYYDDKYYATFIGFAPRERPVISVIVTAKDPHPVHFGGSVAGPVFKRITERALQYLESNREKAKRAETLYE
jgi:cell division protein FtsI/penicillin-binding protein 2